MGKREKLIFGISMVWREPKNHVDDCYFCVVETSCYITKNKQKLTYSSLEPAVRTVPYSDEIPVPIFKELPSLEDEEYMADAIVEHNSDLYFEERGSTTRPQSFNHQN